MYGNGLDFSIDREIHDKQRRILESKAHLYSIDKGDEKRQATSKKKRKRKKHQTMVDKSPSARLNIEDN